MEEIAITGGAGNFGRMLAAALAARGHGLRLLDLPSCDFSFADDLEKTTVFQGDILDAGALKETFGGAELVFHLAAILPPASEEDRDRTFQVNVEGTRRVLSACRSAGGPGIVFASSISVYGESAGEPGLIGPDYPVRPTDIYAESKAACEVLLRESGLPFANLRISGIAIPEFLDPPEPWPFKADQRIELVALSDLVDAMVALVGRKEAFGRTLIIAGGPTWQVTGGEYVRRWGEVMGIPLEEMRFMDRPGWLNWYDTAESQVLLGYQKTTLDAFFAQLGAAVDEALA